MENLIFIGIIIAVLYQIYSTHKNVNKLMEQIEELKFKVEELKNNNYLAEEIRNRTKDFNCSSSWYIKLIRIFNSSKTNGIVSS